MLPRSRARSEPALLGSICKMLDTNHGNIKALLACMATYAIDSGVTDVMWLRPAFPVRVDLEVESERSAALGAMKMQRYA